MIKFDPASYEDFRCPKTCVELTPTPMRTSDGAKSELQFFFTITLLLLSEP